MISIDITKLSEVRKAGDRCNSLGTDEKKSTFLHNIYCTILYLFGHSVTLEITNL